VVVFDSSLTDGRDFGTSTVVFDSSTVVWLISVAACVTPTDIAPHSANAEMLEIYFVFI
jgi:hypothetical protein